jgi:hypothetical protein
MGNTLCGTAAARSEARASRVARRTARRDARRARRAARREARLKARAAKGALLPQLGHSGLGRWKRVHHSQDLGSSLRTPL